MAVPYFFNLEQGILCGPEFCCSYTFNFPLSVFASAPHGSMIMFSALSCCYIWIIKPSYATLGKLHGAPKGLPGQATSVKGFSFRCRFLLLQVQHGPLSALYAGHLKLHGSHCDSLLSQPVALTLLLLIAGVDQLRALCHFDQIAYFLLKGMKLETVL